MQISKAKWSRTSSVILRHYFYSGWAFLIPYLAVYLLYYVTKWPVNPPGAAGAWQAAISEGPALAGANAPSSFAPSHSPIPCLLHVYWALHIFHIICAGFAAWSWIKEYRLQTPDSEFQDQIHRPESAPSGSLPTTYYPLLVRLAPWFLLALIFYIPGVYLEWPSDPWEHLHRINEWRTITIVSEHNAWIKSGYFIPYSFLSWCMGLRQLYWLNFYYTGICLLLCWQYYLFSLACGLGKRASMIFVVIQALLFGNNIFSFYRYYGISSSIYAQLAAIALIRVRLDFASLKTRFVQNRAANVNEEILTQNPRLLFPLASALLTRDPTHTRFGPPGALLPFLSAVICLLFLIAFNHQQGFGIAGLGIAAVTMCGIYLRKRPYIWCIAAAAIVLSAVLFTLYARTEVLQQYRSAGYLNAWYGFNLIDLTSLGGNRMMQIIGAFGLINILAAFLLHKHSVVKWLTITPLFLLLMPCISIPFSIVLSLHGGEAINIIAFQRVLFAIPTGLALCLLGEHYAKKGISTLASGLAVPCLLGLFVVIPSSSPEFNRGWHAVSATPDDLCMRHILEGFQHAEKTIPPGTDFTTSYATGTALRSTGVANVLFADRVLGCSVKEQILSAITLTSSRVYPNAIVCVPPARFLTSARSLAGLLSTHWAAQEAPVDLAAGPQLRATALSVKMKALPKSEFFYQLPKDRR